MIRKSIIALAAVTVVASALAVTGAGAKGPSSANAALCRHGSWQHLMRSDATAFQSHVQCVRYAVSGGAVYALARLHVEPEAVQPADGLSVSTSGFGLQPTTVVITSILMNGTEVTFQGLPVPASGEVDGGPFGHINAPCVDGNVYSATATGTSADSLSTPTEPGITITSNTVTRTSSCP